MLFSQVIGPKLTVAQQKAVQYLEKKVDQMKYGAKPYEVALVTYALMLTKSPKADAAFIVLSEYAQYEGEFCMNCKLNLQCKDYFVKYMVFPLKVVLLIGEESQFPYPTINWKITNHFCSRGCHTNTTRKILRPLPML